MLAGMLFALATPLAEALAQGGCKLVRIAEWPVRRDQHQVIVNGAINGQPVGVLVDTGATTSLVLRSAATRLGLTRRPAPGRRVFGVGGESIAEIAEIEELRIGSSVRRNWSALVAGEHDSRDDVALMLGEDLLENFEVEFDLHAGFIRLYESRDCASSSLAYWSTEMPGVEPIEAGPRIFLTLKINDQPVRAMLDSGATNSVVTAPDAERLGVTPQTPGVAPGGCRTGVGGHVVNNWIGKFSSLVIGNELMRNPKLYFADIWKHTTFTATGSRLPHNFAGLPQMLLGADFLRTHRVLIAYSQRRIYFTYSGGTVFPTREQPSCGAVSTSGR